MPVVTRSCTKQKGRQRIEDETPATTNANRLCRYKTRSIATAKRKILQQENEVKDLQPPSKRAARCRTSRKTSRSTSNPSLYDINNTAINQGKGGHAKTSKCCTSRIPRTVKNKKASSSLSDKDHANKENDDNENEIAEKNISHLNVTLDGNETTTKTPAGCIAARIRSYSALRRSQCRKDNKGRSVNNENNPDTSAVEVRSPLGEVSFNPRTAETDTDSDEDILWKMSRQHHSIEKEDFQDSISNDDISYKKKYFTLVTAMKQLQNTYLRAQQNAERNVKAFDKFNDELKSSLSMEEQKNSLLSEELKIKKGTVDRLQSDLENAKEQLKYLKEEKINIEKHNRERSEKELNYSKQSDAVGKSESLLLKLIEDQKSVIKFYSRLTGVSISDNTCEDSSSFQSLNCTFFPTTNTAHCLQFRLTHDKEFDEIEYSPNPQSPGSEDMLLSLPKYLQENIFFGADQAPRFMAKLLTTSGWQ